MVPSDQPWSATSAEYDLPNALIGMNAAPSAQSRSGAIAGHGGYGGGCGGLGGACQLQLIKGESTRFGAAYMSLKLALAPPAPRESSSTVAMPFARCSGVVGYIDAAVDVESGSLPSPRSIVTSVPLTH